MASSKTELARSGPAPTKAYKKEARQQYGRGSKVPLGLVKDRKLRADLRRVEGKYKIASLRAKDAEILQTNEPGFLAAEDPLEKTYKIRQDEIRTASSVENARKSYELHLDPNLGPYQCQYNRNGRTLLLTGGRGHVAGFTWRDGKLRNEIQLGDGIRDATWLHNDQYFALAQRNNVYIYDAAGVELHRLTKHHDPLFLQFLPYHYLLASMSVSGNLVYTDTSTGKNLTPLSTKLGTPTAFTQNRSNAILHAGHQSGAVTLWSPNSSTPLVKMLPHNGPVRALSIDRSGNYMVSTGQDLQLAVWDLRQMRELRKYSLRRPGQALSISDTGLTAVGWGSQVSVWKDFFRGGGSMPSSPYMSYMTDGERVERAAFCPFEDVLGITTERRFISLLVPGAGEPNFDAIEANPYETTQQRQAAEVQSLLDKIQPEMIALDKSLVGRMDRNRLEQESAGPNESKQAGNSIEIMSKRGRGKNSALRKYLRKKSRKNIVDEKRLRVEQAFQAQKANADTKSARQKLELGPALARFVRKPA